MVDLREGFKKLGYREQERAITYAIKYRQRFKLWNDPGSGIPSGLLAKGNIRFRLFSSFSDVRIEGLVYTLGNFELVSLPNLYEIYGGQIAAGNFSLTSIFPDLNIYLDNDIIREGVWGGSQPPEGERPPYSPVVTVEHWEESY